MSLSLRSLLCVCGLVACSHTAVAPALAPENERTQQATSSEDSVAQPVRETPRLDPVSGTSDPPSTAPANDLQPPSGDARTTSIQTSEDSEDTEDTDPGLRQRIRQAAMADGLL
jgi:hypothetical protein